MKEKDTKKKPVKDRPKEAKRGGRQELPPSVSAEDGVEDIDTRRIKLIQVKVASNLKRRAVRRAKLLDMGLSEYIRFLLYCDIHGFAPKGNE